MRAMLLEYGNYNEIDHYPFQFQFGESLLVAPVVHENTTSQNVFLPEGRWYDFWTNRQFEGPLVIDYPTPKDKIPVFVRAGSVLALNLNDTYKVAEGVGNKTDQFENLSLKIYPNIEGEFKYQWFDLVSKRIYDIKIEHQVDKCIEIVIPPIPHDVTLIIVQSSFSSVLLDERVMSLSNKIESIGKLGNYNGFFDVESNMIYLKLTQDNSPRKINIEL